MKGKLSRRKYGAAFKEEVLQMVFNGRLVSDVARSLGIGENILYRWKSRHKAKENKREEQAPACTGLPGTSQAHPGVGDGAGYLKKTLAIFSCQT